MKLTEITIKPPFNSLFPVDSRIMNAVKEHMEAHGYDQSQPVVVWNDILIDGHTRYQAAKEAGLDSIPVSIKQFEDETQAIEYAIHNQRDRRNMTDADILRCVEVVDVREQRRGRTIEEKLKTPSGTFNSAIKTAKVVGISPRKVGRTRTVLDHADEETKQEVLNGTKSINRAYNETKEKRTTTTNKTKPGKSVFNLTNDNIEWAKWTWNPVTGCLHGCPYCYAKDIAKRFYKEGFKPTYHPHRLSAPKNTKIPKHLENTPGIKNVFVCSMADLFGEWVPDEWIMSVLEVVENSPEWNYIFLTKNPERYLKIEWPNNVWLGATADTQERADRALRVFEEMEVGSDYDGVTFLSCEPLLEEIFLGSGLRGYREEIEPDSRLPISWLIIGGQSKTANEPAKQPEWKWVDMLYLDARKAGVPIYFKPNLTVRPKQYPNND